MVGEVREYDELADIYEKLDTVRITTSNEESTVPLLTLPQDRQLTVKREPSFHAAPYDLCSIPRLMGETDMKHESSRQKLAPVYVGFTFHVGSRFTSNVKHKLSCVNQHEI